MGDWRSEDGRVRRGMEAAIGDSKVTTIKELEEEEVEEAAQTVCWRPVLTPAQGPAPRYLEPVLPAAPNDASDDKLLN